jgi:hypothetical protein
MVVPVIRLCMSRLLSWYGAGRSDAWVRLRVSEYTSAAPGAGGALYGHFGADGGDAQQNITSVISSVSLIRCIINGVYVIKMFL